MHRTFRPETSADPFVRDVFAGSIINFISESVMIGFKCGVALFLASTQLPKLFGIPAAHGDFWENSGTFLKHLNETNFAALTVGGTALAVLVLGKLCLKKLPMPLLVVVAGIVASRRLGLDARGVKLLGEVPQGLPDLGLPAVRWEDLNEMLPLAIACFLLAAFREWQIRQTRVLAGAAPGGFAMARQINDLISHANGKTRKTAIYFF